MLVLIPFFINVAYGSVKLNTFKIITSISIHSKNSLLNQIITNQKKEIENKQKNKNSEEEEIYLKENSELKNTLKTKTFELENLKKENSNLKKKIDDFLKSSNFKHFQSATETKVRFTTTS